MNTIDEKFKIDIVSLYEKQELLAKNYLGVYGLVYKAINKKTSELCILKQIDLKGVPQSGRQEIYKEAIFLSQLHHENILGFLGYQELKDELLYIIQYPDELLSDYFGGEREISNNFIFDILLNVLLGLEFLEKNFEKKLGKIEISPENIVILKDGSVKLCDVLETLKIIKNIRIEQGYSSEDQKGFVAPEEFSLNSIVPKNYTTEFKSIIFSLGMIICKLIDNETYSDFVQKRLDNDSQENMNGLLKSIKEKNIELFEILVFMINYEPFLRYDVQELLNLLKKKGRYSIKKDLDNEELNSLKEIIKKKDKDIFILKDQLRVLSEQNQKLNNENLKIRNKNGRDIDTPQ